MPPPFTKPRIEDSPRRIRVLFAGVFIVDSKRAKLVWEHPYYPTYFFPHSELSERHLEAHQKSSTEDNPAKGVDVYDVLVGGRRAPLAVTKFSDITDGPHRDLSGLLKITFGAMDAWFEEEEEIYVHPKDPYKRVDVLQSSRHVRVEVNGIEVANTHMPRLLFETSLPVRTYIPKTDCTSFMTLVPPVTDMNPTERIWDFLRQGEANYYHVKHSPSGEVAKDVVWWYRNPNLECAAIRGYVAFYDEKVDVWVDGEKQPQPASWA